MKKIMLLAGIVASAPVLAQDPGASAAGDPAPPSRSTAQGPRRMDKTAIKQRRGGTQGNGSAKSKSKGKYKKGVGKVQKGSRKYKKGSGKGSKGSAKVKIGRGGSARPTSAASPQRQRAQPPAPARPAAGSNASKALPSALQKKP